MASKILLLGSLFLTFAFSVVGWSVVINALVKSNQESSYVKSVVPDGTIVDINYHDIYSVCSVIAAACALLTTLSLVSTISQLLSIGRKRRLLYLQAYLMLFGALWLLATVIACDVLFATRSTKITATLDGFALPQSDIQQMEQEIGVSPEYRKKWYLRLCAILPWFAVLFATLSGLLIHKAARNTDDYGGMEATESEKIARTSDVQ
ncbi:hypothetical protein DEU56DRAFT_807468 [Suillus clintonianus]|uniref:uncharacterized protein n=1 Tax=Suillus clintonianus TaxID=1904413 RepID=UPI001B86C730|nr:uncharacterized protein DEU56DRAFT_807468 [Suillus clintonianus]KAG2135257.1 hypothetical protein DEU56DRAFT_807468 [Suillus clintonianus]